MLLDKITSCWTAVDHFKPGVLGWVIGDHSAQMFEPSWNLVAQWNCYFYVTDKNRVYPIFIPDQDPTVKTYITRVEGENTRLRHYLARLHRKTLCYSTAVEMLEHSISIPSNSPRLNADKEPASVG